MSATTLFAAGRAGRRRLATRQRLGLGLLGGLLAIAWLTPWLHDADPARQQLARILEWPSLAAPLGTDHLGRDLLARTASALRLSLGMALLSVVSAAVPGILLGVIAGWRGGWVDRVLGSLADACLALPGLLLVLLLVAIAPGNFWALYVGIALVLWIEYFRVVRARTRVLVASPQLEASRLLGFGPGYLFRRHLWPELAPQVLTLAAFGAASAILAMAALGFVSVGLRPPTAELGLMMTELLPYYHEAPWAMAQPILALCLLVLSLNLLAGKDPR
ncbi:ABC transporter permease [Halomonas sp. PGE1]|jgi:peptide/nickel transport system permease protein|uniref:ABC transporter permease n=1 Tax=Halomonas sp. PGE1 TaxID=2730360 RepID=UPI00147545EF|nr:ABC transporter permease [Halomonas sp. PGE1]QJQ98261.1 ABC transporter permease [Halomonas sp. PGE1]